MTNDEIRMTNEAGRACGFRHSHRGFTFVEVLAALAFLAILMPVIVSGLTISNRASVVSERSALAVELAENKLNELLLNNAWATGETRGDFGQDWPGYRWELSRDTWDVDSMINLTLDVFFTVQGHEHSVRLSTLVPTTTSSQSQPQTPTQTTPSS